MYYIYGGVAAKLAGLYFRRNLGEEITLFSSVISPTGDSDWFILLETHRLPRLVFTLFLQSSNYLHTWAGENVFFMWCFFHFPAYI